KVALLELNPTVREKNKSSVEAFNREVDLFEKIMTLPESQRQYLPQTFYASKEPGSEIVIHEKCTADFFGYAETQPSWEDSLSKLIQFSEGVIQFHQLGWVHKDIKLENVLLCGPPGQERAVLMDFGLYENLQEDM